MFFQLLERSPEKRLGSAQCEHGDITNHRFFNGINWSEVDSLKIKPPFIPKIEFPTDTQNFDSEFTETEANFTPIDESILVNIDNELFKGFSYTNPQLTD
ncbi:protein kinase C delta type-like protein [Leptotrombidium deliense]|uniref:Protein kinase C delta type-like protein n=1 Tax=Leptotrombidium deliense TaxID=299467 RepID=A0A443S5J2_9ACAR|nr:protein kinase C delta type-like protein [Leptotrombidium deliense]